MKVITQATAACGPRTATAALGADAERCVGAMTLHFCQGAMWDLKVLEVE